MTWHLARELVRRGHEVSVFAAPGSDPDLGVVELAVDALPGARRVATTSAHRRTSRSPSTTPTSR